MEGKLGPHFAGISICSYLEDMQNLVFELGLAHRVILFPLVQYILWHAYLHPAHLGICLYETCNLSHAYIAGTSQKFNNYPLAGIPTMASDSPDFIASVERYKTSKIARATDPQSIAQAVNLPLRNSEEHADNCRDVIYLFETKCNIEKQFEPVVRKSVDAHHAS